MSGRSIETRKKTGRPTIFTQELADLICQRVATHPLGLGRLCDMYDDMPTKETVNTWRFKDSLFSSQYTKAKIAQAELLAEDILDIACDGRNDWMESLSDDEKGLGWKLNGEHVQRSRLRIDTNKWLAAKLMPKTYGTYTDDKKDHDSSLIEKLADKLNK
jgi:hypothetical protein